jgi:glycosyltransferase involved in cell wall biosynthesis
VKRNPVISLIVPMYNEGQGVRELLVNCVHQLDALGDAWELILVDDGSTDDTLSILRDLSASSSIIVCSHPMRSGKTAALATGFDRARGDYIFTIDADLQEDLSAIPAMLSLLQNGCDMVVGWRRSRRDPWAKCWVSRIFNAGVRWLSGAKLHDINCGFKGMTRLMMKTLRPYLLRDFHRFLPVIAHVKGSRVQELEVEHQPRQHGASRYGLERYGKAVADLLLWLPWLRGGRLLIFLIPAASVLLLLSGFAWWGAGLLVAHAIYMVYLIFGWFQMSR